MKYEIKGDTLPVVICNLDAGEKMITQSGGMAWMSPNMKMETSTNGGLGKVFGRALSGESVFQNIFTAQGGPGMISFASTMPGCIKAYDISKDGDLVVQKRGFLASETSVQLSVFFNKKLGTGIFGGEGFIMQKLSGSGIAFVEFDGHVVEYELAAGEEIIIDTCHLAAMSATCKMDIQAVAGLKNKLFGGEGLFNTVVTGPGKVWLQTMPIHNLAGTLSPYIVTANK